MLHVHPLTPSSLTPDGPDLDPHIGTTYLPTYPIFVKFFSWKINWILGIEWETSLQQGSIRAYGEIW